MSKICQLQFCHGILANAPKLVSIQATEPVLAPRIFEGNGAPTSSTLAAGNGMYCATKGGFVFAASLVNAGTGYTVGYTMPVNGGTFTTATQITVDAVDTAGKILAWHVSVVGNYSVYPSNPCTTTAGTGSGATFNLAFQPADYYLDTNANALYVCTTPGTNATSAWKQISGGGTQQFKVVSDGGDYWNCNTWDGTTQGSTTIKVAKPHKLRAVNGPTTETLNINGALTVFNYAYTPVVESGVTVEYTRTVSGGSTELDWMTPPVRPGNIIVAESFTTTAPSTLVGVVWIYQHCFWAGPLP